MDHSTEPDAPDAFPAFGGAVLDPDAIERLFQGVVELALRTVNGASSVSIMAATEGGYRTWSSTDKLALALDEAQFRHGAGPALEAIRTMIQSAASIESGSGSWPDFVATALQFGVTGYIATPLRQDSKSLGALTIYGLHEHFGESELDLADTIGAFTSLLMAHTVALAGTTQPNDRVIAALASRQLIGEAKGILMEQQGCGRDEAFNILRRASQRENRKLRDVAEDLVKRAETRRDSPEPPA